ncbi:MAG: AMP-binding protein [Chlamydiae bacterium]|nr:AMP-binding protein [Chlamydiota bacterium]
MVAINSTCPISLHAQLNPQKVAIENDQYRLSYSALNSAITCQQALLKPLDKEKAVEITATATIGTLILYFACLREGFSCCLLHPKDPLLQEKRNTLALQSAPSAQHYETLPTPLQEISPSAFTYLYTSGTSAKPKIAALSYSNFYYSALGALPLLKLDPESRYLLSLPLFHVSGLSPLFRSFLSGATLILPPPSYDLFALIQEKKISHLSLVSTQYVNLLANLSGPLPSLKGVLLGGSAFSTPILEQGLDKKLPLYLSYGLTEMSSTVCCNPLMETKDPTHVGCLLPYRHLQLAPDDEILLHGETLFQGYYDSTTKKLIRQNAPFATKDLGRLSGKNLKILGRKDRLMISGGENIQPEEVEKALLEIPSIQKACVLAVPDNTYGQKVIAFLYPPSTLPYETLKKLLAQKLPGYKIPKAFLPWPEALLPEGNKISTTLQEKLLKFHSSII